MSRFDDAALLMPEEYSAYNSGNWLSWVEGNAEDLPFDDNSMDSCTIAFGIRNVTDRHKALCEAYRVRMLHVWD